MKNQFHHRQALVLVFAVMAPISQLWSQSISGAESPDKSSVPDKAGEGKSLIDLAGDDGGELRVEEAGKTESEPISGGSKGADDPVPASIEKPEFAEASAEMEMQKTADEGIHIQVEKSTARTGVVNEPGTVKIYSPWPAKPITPAPEGWMFAHAPAGLAPYRTTVKLSGGSSVDLTITPFVLVPRSDGLNAIRIVEPGFDPAKDMAQGDTIGNMLQNATEEVERHEQQAGAVIRRLQQLLSSLPRQQTTQE